MCEEIRIRFAKVYSESEENNELGRALFYCDETEEDVQVGGLKHAREKRFAGFLGKMAFNPGDYNFSQDTILNGRNVCFVTDNSNLTVKLENKENAEIGDFIFARLEDGRLYAFKEDAVDLKIFCPVPYKIIATMSIPPDKTVAAKRISKARVKDIFDASKFREYMENGGWLKLREYLENEDEK